MKGLQHIIAFFQRTGGSQPSLRSGRNGSRPGPWTGASPAKEKLSTCIAVRPCAFGLPRVPPAQSRASRGVRALRDKQLTLMKTSFTKSCSALVALALALVLTSAQGQAMPPLGRHATGAVRDVDRAAQTLTIASSAASQPRVFRWNDRTRFVAGTSFITSAAVPRGATVAYIYRTPLIGEPFVTKVTLLHPLLTRGNAIVQPLSSHARRP